MRGREETAAPLGAGAIPQRGDVPPYRRTRGPRADPRRPHHRLRQASPAAASRDAEERGRGGEDGGGVRVPPLSHPELLSSLEAPLWSFSTSTLVSCSLGESLDLVGSGEGCHPRVAYLLWGVVLKTLISFALLVGLDATSSRFDMCPTGDGRVPCDALCGNNGVDERRSDHINTLLVASCSGLPESLHVCLFLP
jgi:hypothetical protein